MSTWGKNIGWVHINQNHRWLKWFKYTDVTGMKHVYVNTVTTSKEHYEEYRASKCWICIGELGRYVSQDPPSTNWDRPRLTLVDMPSTPKHVTLISINIPDHVTLIDGN